MRLGARPIGALPRLLQLVGEHRVGEGPWHFSWRLRLPMSCDFHVYCRDCDEAHPFQDANWGDKLMHHLIAHAPAIAALEPLLRDSPETIDFRTFYGHIDPSWFAAHLGHALVVRDEYGKIDGTCGQRFNCSSCKTPHYCRLPKAHPGSCAPTT